jgi:predicted metal-dependent enzyme (double-stranded beta helix superfamily)
MSAVLPLPLASFVGELERLLAVYQPEPAAPPRDFLALSAQALGRLVRDEDWLPLAYTVPHPDYYQQFLLYRDPEARFSVVSFVWGPGQQTPIHDHQVWGLVGVLRGAEYSQGFAMPMTTGSRSASMSMAPISAASSAGSIRRAARANPSYRATAMTSAARLFPASKAWRQPYESRHRAALLLFAECLFAGGAHRLRGGRRAL